MLILKTLYWSNAFSYGMDNEIKLNGSRVTQLIGLNGHGKSSIPLILQEVLYNKNSKGAKKADIPNRNTDDKSYSIAVDFELEGSEYFFSIVRKGATTKTELLKDGEDIGAHTATATYNQVADLLGMDFSTFCQLVYQSANSSLEFLTATDTTRKKFLISLLNLGEYSNQEVKLKKLFTEVNTELAAASATVNTISTWLDKSSSVNTELREVVEIPKTDEDFQKTLAELKHASTTAEATNKQVVQQKALRKKIEDLEKVVARGKPPAPEIPISLILEKKGKLASIKANAVSMKRKVEDLGDSCPTCLSKVNRSWVLKTIDEQEDIISRCKIKEGDLLEEQQKAELIGVDIKAYDDAAKALDAAMSSLVDSVPDKLVSIEGVKADIESTQAKLKAYTDSVKAAEAHNRDSEAHNNKVALILEQTESYHKELSEKSIIMESLQRRVGRLDILKRAFSTKGLVAYKIESMIKDLEVLINKYLIEMSDGRFSLAFVVSGDKLNVELLDGSNLISISALSSGELARVNIATLLAIRKLMNTLSNTKLNLLFLDEVTSVLDDEGREKLVEVLNKEIDLNAFIVSHGWQHPLVDKVEVIKTDKISRVEY